MKITRIRVYKTDLPYTDGAYGWGAGNAITVAKASVVVMDTDAGVQGLASPLIFPPSANLSQTMEWRHDKPA